MKSLTLKLVIPITIISFATLTKWWYTLPDDAPDTIFTGFPFPFVCNGWHTSLSLQIFVGPLILDLLTYFICWLVLFYCFNRYITKLKTHKLVTISLWTVSIYIVTFATLIAADKNNLFYLKQPYKMEVMETGFQFGWQNIERPDIYKYHPEKRNQK